MSDNVTLSLTADQAVLNLRALTTFAALMISGNFDFMPKRDRQAIVNLQKIVKAQVEEQGL